jgi:Holliday junction resolvasome RuvABC endonuclease subunit|tara:strand:+ start:1513 stop:2241 length:729 start_codon:yes stop_codon:yes gene_type:complete
MDNGYVLGLDVSTKTTGVALLKDNGTDGELTLLTHVSPVVKPKPLSKLKEQFEKVSIFEAEFLDKYKDLDIRIVVIEEPLLQSNNIYTAGTLLRFNGMIARAVYETLGVVPVFVSSYDARKYAFPDLMEIRTVNKKGEPYTEKEISKKHPVLFGGYDWGIDKKTVIWDKVADLEPKIDWLFDKKQKLKKENYDMADAYACVRGYMHKEQLWGDDAKPRVNAVKPEVKNPNSKPAQKRAPRKK